MFKSKNKYTEAVDEERLEKRSLKWTAINTFNCTKNLWQRKFMWTEKDVMDIHYLPAGNSKYPPGMHIKIKRPTHLLQS